VCGIIKVTLKKKREQENRKTKFANFMPSLYYYVVVENVSQQRGVEANDAK
jgi:hypothetical protein